jgi:hypothetical protein
MEAPMAQGSYRQFCPVAMAAEILCTRWTVLVVIAERIYRVRRPSLPKDDNPWLPGYYQAFTVAAGVQ